MEEKAILVKAFSKQREKTTVIYIIDSGLNLYIESNWDKYRITYPFRHD